MPACGRRSRGLGGKGISINCVVTLALKQVVALLLLLGLALVLSLMLVATPCAA